MPVLYVTQPGAEVRKKDARLQVEWQGQVLAAMPLRLVERLVLMGPVQLSAAATQVLLQAKKPVLFCSHNGKFYGILSSGHENVEILLRQVACYQDSDYRLSIAKSIVATKITHQYRLLQRYARNHPDPFLTETAEQLKGLRETLQGRSSVPEVTGVEGQASAIYFAAFGHCLRREGITFEGRNRRPPKDPVNAILSLSYMLLLNEVLSIIVAAGLNPGIGFLHEINRRHPALALDILEIARQPVADRLTLSLFNLGVLTPDDFLTTPAGETRLKEGSLKRFLSFYERAMTTNFRRGDDELNFRDWLRLQITDFRDALCSQRPWQPQALEM